MTGKDFLNYKKPHFWIALAVIFVLILAIVVGVLDKEEPVQVVVPPEEEVSVEVEEPEEEPKKKDGQIILERFAGIDWSEVKANAKNFGEEGWENGIVRLAELPEEKIALYGYNDEEYKLRGVAIDHEDNVNFFDWVYMSKTHQQPEMYWDEEESQLQVTLNTSKDEEKNYEELHLLQEYETMTLEDFVLTPADYITEIEEKLGDYSIGAYANIILGEELSIQFTPVAKDENGDYEPIVYYAEILVQPDKDGITFEIGQVGPPPERREAKIKLEGVEETYTELKYVSKQGYEIWYPENLLATTINGREGFIYKTDSDETIVQLTLVSGEEMKLNNKFLEETAENYKTSKEFKKVKISEIQKLTPDNKDISSIRMISVTHDDSVSRFYVVKGGDDQVYLITLNMPAEAIEGWGARIDEMVKNMTFEKETKEAETV